MLSRIVAMYCVADGVKKYGGDTIKGSILDKKVITTNIKLERIRQFGPSWSWMSLSREAKNQEWEIEFDV